ncbi:bifunctional 4-hydroxy-2-oxoglutarate aldolase/2-dehydro-3-deoxy-phosphogluconate aldolase [Microbacterium enclense]|uniref:bifunctional 4-hydroxy-2-oxoglutarate aldolase/2-dehydro-3-deoxy-phosphogluconate aldolase n=1 Tax=Microbacterium enclense TaxID=993073 RepID=UPI0036D84716
MLTHAQTLSLIQDTGVVLIIRLDDADKALEVARAAVAGGIRALEITLSVPRALELVTTLADEFAGTGVAVGAGTVIDADSAVRAIHAGASLLVSPQLDPAMIATGRRHGVVTIGGALTPTEIVQTLRAGADLVKLFPTEIAGPDYLRAVRAPLASVPILPAGGVTVDTVGPWFAAGAVAVGVGSAVTRAGSAGDVTRAAREMLAAVAAARRSPVTAPHREEA